MEDILLLEKKIIVDKSPVLLSYTPGEDWQEYWDVMDGQWRYEEGWLIGQETRNRGGILFSKQRFEGNIMLSFTAATVLPATRDVNAVYHANWNNDMDGLGEAYVVGFNGWFEEKSGIEKNRSDGLYATTSLYKYVPGQEIQVCTGVIDGQNFLFADGVLVAELRDPSPLTSGHVGFSPYCTKLRIKDIEVRQICWEERIQSYEPEF